MSSSDAHKDESTTRKPGAAGNQARATSSQQELEDVLLKDISTMGKGALKSLSGFRAFILRGSVVDLAIGVVIGAAFSSIITAFVKDIITPLVPIPHNKGLASASLVIPWTGGTLNYGDFLSAVISFLLVAAIVYFFVVQPVNALMNISLLKEATIHQTRDCPYCFQAIHLRARRCPFCTSHLDEGREPGLSSPPSLEKTP